MEGREKLNGYPDVSFIDGMTLEGMQGAYMQAMAEKYRELTGEEMVLGAADPIRLIAHADCLLLYQLAQYVERAGKMSLLKYSYGDYLDNIGALKGVRRMEGAAATARLKFTLSAVRDTPTAIPAGTRVTAGDGAYFYTLGALEIPAGQQEGEVAAACKEKGAKGNGHAPGEISIMVDPVAYVASVKNTEESSGGADRESDASLAERIYLAPSAWSTAGPDDAYRYWTKSYSPAITDVRVSSPGPGLVDIRILLQGGQMPGEALMGEVEKYLSNEGIKPLTDKVSVKAPEPCEYTVDVTYYINESDRGRAQDIQEAAEDAVQEYIRWQQEKIGRDINPDQLRKLLLDAGAKRAEVREPAFKKTGDDAIASLSAQPNATYGGIEDD